MPGKTRRDSAAPPVAGATDWKAIDAMTDAEAEAAALADPDAPPLTPGRPLRPVAKVKRIRWQLRLSREAFAARYRMPLEVVIAWERHELEPDAVANTFLDAIAADPEGVARAVSGDPTRVATAK